jgi:hypothetical protein
MSQLADEGRLIEHGTSRTGRWLRARRMGFALWIAVIEAIIVLVFHDVSKWTVIGLAIVAVAIYAVAGRESRSDTFRQISWIFAASQLLAVIAAILAFILLWTVIIAVVIFAFVALFFVFSDRR